MVTMVNGKWAPSVTPGGVVNGRYVAEESPIQRIIREQKATNLSSTTAQTPAQINEKILASLGLDTVLTPKKRKTPQAGLPAQTELVNKLGE